MQRSAFRSEGFDREQVRLLASLPPHKRVRVIMVIGAFAGTVYGITRVTYDIDIVVELMDEHVDALSAAYPLPRYYADPVMIQISKEGRSRKHETDILEMMRYHYLKKETNESNLNEDEVDRLAKKLGDETSQFWQDIKSDAMKEAGEE